MTKTHAINHKNSLSYRILCGGKIINPAVCIICSIKIGKFQQTIKDITCKNCIRIIKAGGIK